MDHDEITFKAFATFICKHRNIKKKEYRNWEIVKNKNKRRKYIHETCAKHLHADSLTYKPITGPNFQHLKHPPNTQR